MENPEQSRTGPTWITESFAVFARNFLMSPSGEIE
jgi:hypothetical protein